MENGELGEDLQHGFLVEEQTFVVNHEDVTEEENNSDSNSGNKNAPLREQDRFLPIANIAKIMKRAIPENGKIAKDARECVQECISEFISFVTSEASDRCLVEKRKTINGEDVLFAMNALGFDNYVEPLKLYLKKYRDMVLSPVNTSKVLPVALTQKPVHTAKPVSLNKLNNAIVVFEEKGSNDTETEIETQGEATIIYTYPKDLGNFTIG